MPCQPLNKKNLLINFNEIKKEKTKLKTIKYIHSDLIHFEQEHTTTSTQEHEAQTQNKKKKKHKHKITNTNNTITYINSSLFSFIIHISALSLFL